MPPALAGQGGGVSQGDLDSFSQIKPHIIHQGKCVYIQPRQTCDPEGPHLLSVGDFQKTFEMSSGAGRQALPCNQCGDYVICT